MPNQSREYYEIIKDYEKQGKAIAHFNISSLDQLRVICEVAQELHEPIIIGLSEGEREYIGVDMARALVNEMKKEFSVPIFLNADHTYTFDKVKQVVEAGYDSVIVDGAKLSYEENVKLVKECVEWVREYERENNKRILVEAELGYIGQSSSLNSKLPEGVSESNLTTREQARDFVLRTGIDLFAPAVGNIHGMLIDAPEPKLHVDRISEIRDAAGVPLVLHGASGNTNEDLLNSIRAGISIIHINTEIRKAFRDGIKDYMHDNPNEIAPYKFDRAGAEEMKKVVRAKMELYKNSI